MSEALQILNLLAFMTYLVLSGVILAVLISRYNLYRRAKERIPVLLKRDIVLFGAIVILFGESLLIRSMNITIFIADDWPRLVFILQQNIIGIGALVYWAKVELTDLN